VRDQLAYLMAVPLLAFSLGGIVDMSKFLVPCL